MKKENIIQKDGKYYTEADVVMLPTENPTKLIYRTKDHQVHWREYYGKPHTHMGDTYIHLYFLSNEEIKEREWFKNDFGIWQHNGMVKPNSNPKKIIATTDESLIPNCDGKCAKNECVCSLPRPSNEFLQAYARANGDIKKVLIEVEAVMIYDTPDVSKIHNKGTVFDLSEETENIPHEFKLKVAEDNTITIQRQ